MSPCIRKCLMGQNLNRVNSLVDYSMNYSLVSHLSGYSVLIGLLFTVYYIIYHQIVVSMYPWIVLHIYILVLAKYIYEHIYKHILAPRHIRSSHAIIKMAFSSNSPALSRSRYTQRNLIEST